MKILFCIVLLPFTFYLLPISIHAAYVLPYPSYMPGNKLYKLSRFADQLKKYWYWGNIAKTKYYLSLSDKYLVEAKTLFEYQQYLLAVDALHRSDVEIQQLIDLIHKAEKDNKNMKTYRRIIDDAMASHQVVLQKLIQELPVEFLWQPEHNEAQLLRIQQELIKAQTIRVNISNKILNE